MKKIRLALFACLAFAAFGIAAIAADSAPNAAPAKTKQPNRIDILTQELALDAKQKAAIGKLYKAESDQVKAIRADDKLSKKEQNTRVAEIRAKLKADIRAQLKPEQAKKFDEKK